MNKALDILIIDDDALFVASLSDFLISKGLNVQTAPNGREGISRFENSQPPLALLDQELPDIGGIEVCQRILEINPNAKIIFMTAYATVEYAVEAMQAGAYNYLSKPFALDELLIAINLAAQNAHLEGRIRIHDYETEKVRQEQKLIGSSEIMKRIGEQIKLSASSEANVLITGDTGVGKPSLPGLFMISRIGGTPFSRSIAQPYRRTSWRPSILVTRRGCLPAQKCAVRAFLSSPTAVRLCSTRLAKYQYTCRASYSRCLMTNVFDE